MNGVSDIRVATTWPHHTKRLQLQARLGAVGVVALLDLWCYAGANKPHGELRGMDAGAVELAAGWTGDPGLFVATLKDLRLLDGPPRRFKLHNWSERQPFASGSNERTQNASRAGKASALKRKEVNASLPFVEQGVERPVQPLPPSLPPSRTNQPTSPPSLPSDPPDPELGSEGGIGVVGRAFERGLGKILAGKELLDVRRWLARGVTPARFAEAIDVVCAAVEQPRSRWAAILTIVRDTPPEQPMRWGGGESGSAPASRRGVSGADLARLSEDLERTPPALDQPPKPKDHA